jgi:cytochrome c556
MGAPGQWEGESSLTQTPFLAAILWTTALLALTPAYARNLEAPSVKEIMGKANKPTGIYFNLGQDLKDDNPAWPDIQQEAKELKELADALHQAAPPRGDKASWDKLTSAYANNAKVLLKAAAKMDQAAAREAHAKMGGNACMTCHKAHRPAE